MGDEVCVPRNGYCDPGTIDMCGDGDCASDMWKDGCLRCMCFNNGNDSWCDGSNSDYYDNYFNKNGENPFGDKNRANRKCNKIFSPMGNSCRFGWECEKNEDCVISNNDSNKQVCCARNKINTFSSTYHCVDY